MTAVCVCGASFDRILNQSVGSLREYDSVEDNKNFKWDKDWAVRRTILLQSPTATSTASAYKWLEQASRIWRWNGLTSHGDLKHAPLLKKKNESMFITAKRKEIGACKRGGRPGVRTLFDDGWWTLECASSSIGVRGMSAALIFGQSRAQLAGFGSTKFSNSRVPVLIEVYNFLHCIDHHHHWLPNLGNWNVPSWWAALKNGAGVFSKFPHQITDNERTRVLKRILNSALELVIGITSLEWCGIWIPVTVVIILGRLWILRGFPANLELLQWLTENRLSSP